MPAFEGCGPERGSPEMDALQFDLHDVLLGHALDAAFRTARCAAAVIEADHFRGRQEYADSFGLPMVLRYSFDGRRLVLELEYDAEEDARLAAAPAHAAAA